MISAVTVAYTQYPDAHIETLIKSLKHTTTKVKEINVVYNKDKPFCKTETKGKMLIRHISPEPVNISYKPKNSKRVFSYDRSIYQDHSFALHKAIEYVGQDYVMITDPDVTFYMQGFDEMYLDLYKKYDLNIIGVSHYDETPYLHFPTVINCLIKTSKLPDKEWMKGELKLRPDDRATNKYSDDWPIMDGYYLLPGPVKSRYKEFPNPRSWYQTGCNLFLWDKDNGSRNVTFVCDDTGINYKTSNVTSSLEDFRPNLKDQMLMKHVKGYYVPKDISLEMVQGWHMEAKNKSIKI